MNKIIIFLVLGITSFTTSAQDFSNKGKDFWLGYGYHVRFFTNGGNGTVFNAQEMVLYFATENIPGQNTNITIEIPAVGYVENINNVPPGTIVTSAPIPKSGGQDARLTAEGKFNSGIHVTSTNPVVAYAHIYNENVSGATLLFPTNTLGKEYYSINYNQVSNENLSNGFFFVVATDTGTTTVEITPSQNTTSSPAGVPFTVNLNQGEIYNVMGALNSGGGGGNFTGVDLTGSRIRSISTGDIGCKKIGVFSGSGKIKISCGSPQSSDNLIAQALPRSAWGKKYLTAPTENMPYNYFRIAVSDPATNVKVNGTPISGIINNFYYDLPLTNTPQLIEADQPIMVAQYVTTVNTCGNNSAFNEGDPDMIYLSPVEQTISQVVLNSTNNYNITQHRINVIIKTNVVPSFTITGALIQPSFQLHPQDPSYSYAQISVSAGSHTLSADSGFNAIAYGFGRNESYAYNAGTNLKDLYNFVAPLNPLNITGQNTACACTPFFYTITYPFQPTTLLWDFKGYQTPNVALSNPVADTTYFINGKQVWRYKLTNAYTYCPAGNYPIAITAGTPGTDGCGNIQIKEDTLYVKNTPTPNFNWTNNGCVSDSVYFKDISIYDPGTYSYKWYWDFGDGNTSNDHNPAHKYANPGTYTVKFYLVSNIGCISNIKQYQVTVTNKPIANFGLIAPLCDGKPIVFSDSSVVFTPGTISKWIWDYGDGTKDTLTSANGLQHTYTAGPKTIGLQVITSSGCISTLTQKNYTINANPVANFTLPTAVCLPYQSANFINTSTISDGTQNTFTYKWKFGDPLSGALDSSILKDASHLYSNVGPFSIYLQVKSAAGCVDDTVKVLSAIYKKPTASFTTNAENCLTTPTVITSNNNGQGGIINNYFWNYGNGATQGSVANPTYVYPTADTFNITHWIQTDKGCYSDTASKTIIINPLPTVGFTTNLPACATKNVLFTDTSKALAGNIIKWTWNFANGRPDSILNTVTPFNYSYTSAGTYPVKLSVETDKGCKNAIPIIQNVVIHPQPLPAFVSPEVCLSDASAIFNDTSSVVSGNITTWAWNFGDPASGINNTSNLQFPQHRYNAIGSYTATLTVTTNNNCVATLPQTFTVNGDIPVSNFFSQTIGFCGNDSTVIRDSSTVNFGSVTKVLIVWDNDFNPTVVQTDDLPFVGKLYKHKYPEFQTPLTKIFKVRYRAYSGATCVNEITKPITVYAVPKVQFTNVPNICLDASARQIIEATEIGGVQPGNGIFTGTGISNTGLFNPALVTPNTYTIKYVYTSNFGCKDSASNTLKVLAPAIANYGTNRTLCANKLITFYDSSTIPTGVGTIVKYVWSFGDGTADSIKNNNTNVTHTYSLFGNYTTTLTITTSNGCIVSKQKIISVKPLPTVNFRPADSLCLPNANVQFTNLSTMADGTDNALTYRWNFGDATSTSNTSSSKNPTHIYTSTGPYNVLLECTSGSGCIKDTTIALTTIHPKPTANFTSDSASLCEKQFVQFKDLSTGADGTINAWSWNFGNGQTTNVKIPTTQTYITAGTYNIKLQVKNNFGCLADTTKIFKVYSYPVISAGPDRVLLEGGELTINATATGNRLTYSWLPTTFLYTANLLQPIIRGLNNDITYQLTVTAEGGCYKKDAVLIEILRAPVIPNTFTPNGDGANETWVIKNLENYPNCKIQVFNRYGQIVYEANSYTPPGWNGTYNGKSLPFGTYYYIIEPGSGRKPMSGYVTILK